MITSYLSLMTPLRETTAVRVPVRGHRSVLPRIQMHLWPPSPRCSSTGHTRGSSPPLFVCGSLYMNTLAPCVQRGKRSRCVGACTPTSRECVAPVCCVGIHFIYNYGNVLSLVSAATPSRRRRGRGWGYLGHRISGHLSEGWFKNLHGNWSPGRAGPSLFCSRSRCGWPIFSLIYCTGSTMVQQLAPVPHNKKVLGLSPPIWVSLRVFRLQTLCEWMSVSLWPCN